MRYLVYLERSGERNYIDKRIHFTKNKDEALDFGSERGCLYFISSHCLFPLGYKIEIVEK